MDEDLLQTILNIYPEWFGEDFNTMTDESGRFTLQNESSLGSPPKSEVDEGSLQQAMGKNRESLKVKLMLRRPINQLVEQGILPRKPFYSLCKARQNLIFLLVCH